MYGDFLKQKSRYKAASLVCLVCSPYFLDNQSFTSSGAMTDSTKVYAPVFGDFTILMAFVNLFELLCNVATVFFAMSSYLISLWTVMRLRIGLNFLICNLSGVFFLFFVVMYREVPGIPDSLCSVHSNITWILFPFFAILLFFLLYVPFCTWFFQYGGDSFLIDNFNSFRRNI